MGCKIKRLLNDFGDGRVAFLFAWLQKMERDSYRGGAKGSGKVDSQRCIFKNVYKVAFKKADFVGCKKPRTSFCK